MTTGLATWGIWALTIAMMGCGAVKQDNDPDGAGDATDATGDAAGDVTGDVTGDATGDTGGGDAIADALVDLPDGSHALTGTLRDFLIAHPDFENELGTETGIVEDELGTDAKPVYAGGDGTITTHGQAAFDQWYRDVDGVNMGILFTIVLSDAGGGVYTYQNPAFFPIDDQLFGNEGNPHNYHFTYEIHTRFQYRGGEVFTFTGDDDLFVFVNHRLALDLGGVHGPLSGTVDFDDQAFDLGIGIGGTYDFDFFFAERHTTESNFRIDTTIEEFIIY